MSALRREQESGALHREQIALVKCDAAAGEDARAPGRNRMGRVPAPQPEEAAVRDAQQGDRDGRAPRSQEHRQLFLFNWRA